MSEEEIEKKKELRAWLEDEYWDKIEKLKGHIGLVNNTEFLRFLINKEYRRVFENSQVKNVIQLINELLDK